MKKRRIYLQNEPIWLIQSFFMVVCTFGSNILGIIFLIMAFVNGFDNVYLFNEVWIHPLFIFFLIVAPIVIFFDTVAMLSWNIHMDDWKVWMNGDRLSFKKCRVQLPVCVMFKSIISIGIEKSYKNSSGQTIQRVWRFGPRWSQKTYLVFNVGKRKKRMNISHYTDDYLLRIIEEIIKRIELCQNNCYDGKTAIEILSKYHAS